MSREPSKEPKPAVPIWVAVVTFLVCWGLGPYLLVVEQAGSGRNGLLFVGVLLILFPLLSFQGITPVLIDALSRIFGGRER